MTSRARLSVLLISFAIIVFVVVGGFLNRAVAREDSYQHLRVFDDAVSLILNNYVETVDPDKIMAGAMRGLAEGLDPDCAWLTPAEVTKVAKRTPPASGTIGVELTRQYYLRVIAARDGSPAEKAGLRTGDFIRAIDGKPTREMSVWTGMDLLRGAPGSKISLTVIRGNAAEPHVVDVVRQDAPAATVTGRIVKPGVGLVRIAAFNDRTAGELKQEVATLTRDGATKLIIDVRSTAEGAPELGIASARLFVPSGVLISVEGRSEAKKDISASAGDGTLAQPTVLLVNNGTSQAAEVFAAALSGRKRAELVGEHTLGRAAMQELVRLPDGSGLWLSTERYVAPGGTALHEKGLTPDIAVNEPDIEFGAEPPTTDPILDKALERLTSDATAQKAAA
jgi:carboxyl-terminal processing protease